MMKSSAYTLWMAMIIFISTGCSKNDFAKKFTVAMEREFTMPAGLNIFDAHYFVFNEMTTNYAQIISSHDIEDPSKITLVPEKAVIYSRVGGVDFDFVERAYIRLYTNERPNDKVESFYIELVPNSVDDVLELIPTSYNALHLLKSGLVNAEIKFILKRTSPLNMDMTVRMDFRGNY